MFDVHRLLSVCILYLVIQYLSRNMNEIQLSQRPPPGMFEMASRMPLPSSGPRIPVTNIAVSNTFTAPSCTHLINSEFTNRMTVFMFMYVATVSDIFFLSSRVTIQHYRMHVTLLLSVMVMC